MEKMLSLAKIQAENERESLPSVNLSLDGKDPFGFLENFYLSKKGTQVISQVLSGVLGDRRKRVGTVTAPPGSGKSYLSLLLGTLFCNDKKWNESILKILSSQNSFYYSQIEESVKQFIKSGTKLLPVYITGESSNLKKTVLEAVLFSASWKAEEGFEEKLFLEFKDSLGFQRKSSDLKKLISRISESFETNEEFFILYKSVLEFLEKLGFSGCSIFHDEFNRFLTREHSISTGDLDFLQDFAEFNLRQKKITVIHYLLLHKGISQYLSGIDPEKRKEWLKIEGRFHPIHFQEELSDTYGLVSNYIQKNARLKNISRKDAHIEKEIKEAFKIHPFLKDEIGPELKEITKQAYPLHISTLTALPLLSGLFGQNERTLFAYLSGIAERKNTDFIRIDDLFDYFDSSIDKLGLEDTLLTRWQYGRNALSECEDRFAAKIIKILTILSVINRKNLLPADEKWIQFCVGEEGTVKSVLKELVSKNQAVYREAGKTYQIYYGSSIHLQARIEEYVPSVLNSDTQKVLDRHFPLRPIYADAYNAEYLTSRFYSRKLILESTLKDFIQFSADSEGKTSVRKNEEELQNILQNYFETLLEKERKSGASGLFIYYLGNPKSVYAEAVQHLLKNSDTGRNLAGVFSRYSFTEEESLKKFEAAERLSEDPEVLRIDSRISEDVKVFLSDIHERVEHSVQKLFRRDSAEITVHHDFISQSQDLESVVSFILKKRYPSSPKINSEFVNREHLTPVIRNTRKKILRAMIAGDRSVNFRTNGYGPDVAIFRSLFSAKKCLDTDKEAFRFHFEHPKDYKGAPDEGLKKVILEIQKFLEKDSEKHSLDTLYSRLTAEPYGMYTEIIPFYFLSVLLSKGYSFSVYEEDRYEKDFSSDLLEKMHLHPEKFRVKILKTSLLMDEYLSAVSRIFQSAELAEKEDSVNFPDKRKISENKIYRSVLSILYWYTRLPEYTRRTKTFSEENLRFLDTISKSSNPELLLLEEIPSIFGFNLKTVTEKELEKFIKRLESLRFEVDSAYTKLLHSISRETVRLLQPYIRFRSEEFLPTVENFRKERKYHLEVLKNHDESFRKLYERLHFPYAKD
ncbi:MAG TPA: hypothetical protein PK453_11265, partial [Leptospiraceae bacterium]|nr:hypothetical protein [Leptospiraceae bacterium]